MIGTLLLNRYEIIEKIGEGGMGIVYKAKCSILNRLVAIKILKFELSMDENFINRFKREANSIASLSHPNIVNIYDVGSENNINFIVMEYVNGGTLKSVIKKDFKLSIKQTLDIASQIAKALEYAHKNKIVHRDIKPDNILVSEDNIVKLTDFGIAKVADSATLTNSNKVIGSVHYFSPEQAKGKFVDFRTDIYALGIVMYEMLTGQVPFNGNTSISVAVMHIQEPVIPPIKISCDIPENINLVVLKALEKEPVNRFQSTSEFIKILDSIKENMNIKIDFDNKSGAETIIMTEPDLSRLSKQFNSTVVLNHEEVSTIKKISEIETISDTLEVDKTKIELSPKGIIIKNKRIFLASGFIAFLIIGFLVNYLYNKPSSSPANEITSTDKTISKPNISEKKLEAERRNVPSLVGQTQDIAKSIIASNEFSLGTVTSEYSDNIPKGLVISQSPSADSSYEKNGKINLVISQGQKILQIESQANNSANPKENGNGKAKGKEKGKKDKD